MILAILWLALYSQTHSSSPLVVHSTGRSQLTNDEESDLVRLLKSLDHRVATLGVHAVKKLFPPETACLQTNRQELVDAPLFGSPENHYFSTLQINISPLNKADLSSLGYGGCSHIDRQDDPMHLKNVSLDSIS